MKRGQGSSYEAVTDADTSETPQDNSEELHETTRNGTDYEGGGDMED